MFLLMERMFREALLKYAPGYHPPSASGFSLRKLETKAAEAEGNKA